MSGWLVVECELAQKVALAVARGCYQRGLARGEENLSGSTIRGTAARWGSRYKASRENFLARLDDWGVLWREEKHAHGKRVLVLVGVHMDGEGQWLVEASSGEAVRALTFYESETGKVLEDEPCEVVDGFSYFARTGS